jgi:hypothetical protein
MPSALVAVVVAAETWVPVAVAVVRLAFLA